MWKTVTVGGESFNVLKCPELMSDNGHADGCWYQANAERVSDGEPCVLEWCWKEDDMNWDEVAAILYSDDEYVVID